MQRAPTWLTMFEALDLGVTYRDLMAFAERGEVLTRRSGRAVFYDRGSLLRCLAADATNTSTNA